MVWPSRASRRGLAARRQLTVHIAQALQAQGMSLIYLISAPLAPPKRILTNALGRWSIRR
jgi:hypothetical protein